MLACKPRRFLFLICERHQSEMSKTLSRFCGGLAALLTGFANAALGT